MTVAPFARLISGAAGVTGLRFIGIALARTRHGWHLGLLHRKAQGPVEVLHLATDRALYNETPSEAYSWVQIRLPEPRLRALAAHCRRIWERNGQATLRYALRYEDASFDASGALALTPDTHGLTCATFVLAVFRSLGIRLLECNDWPPAIGDDAVWQRQIIGWLCPVGSDPAWRATLLRELPTARFHPIEVTAAALRAPESTPTAWRTATFGRCELEACLRARGVPLL